MKLFKKQKKSIGWSAVLILLISSIIFSQYVTNKVYIFTKFCQLGYIIGILTNWCIDNYF